jgi:hypothetical protein
MRSGAEENGARAEGASWSEVVVASARERERILIESGELAEINKY